MNKSDTLPLFINGSGNKKHVVKIQENAKKGKKIFLLACNIFNIVNISSIIATPSIKDIGIEYTYQNLWYTHDSLSIP